MIKQKKTFSKFLSKSLESYLEFEEKWGDALAKFLTNSFGTLKFLNLILLLIGLWIIVNLEIIPGLEPFDIYPFNWLMTLVQLFGIVLSIVVLISQRREERINEIYQKVDFEINVRAEREITKILHMIDEIHKELGIAKTDKELEEMKKIINIGQVKEDVEQLMKERDDKSGIM